MSTNINNLKVSGSNIHSNKHQPQQQSHQQQQQKPPSSSSSSSAVSIQSQHTVPPRYQPPPQPPGGILKNIPSSKSVLAYYPQPSDIPSSSTVASSHLNIKYPPDVPKLAAVYIPEGLRSVIPSVNQPKGSLAQRQIQHRHSTGQILNQQIHQQQPHHQPLHRINTDERQQQAVANAQLLQHQQQQHLHHQQQQQHFLHQQQQQQQQDMLKFVRKPDATEPNVGGATAVAPPSTNGRLSAEQNRHLQQVSGILSCVL